MRPPESGAQSRPAGASAPQARRSPAPSPTTRGRDGRRATPAGAGAGAGWRPGTRRRRGGGSASAGRRSLRAVVASAHQPRRSSKSSQRVFASPLRSACTDRRSAGDRGSRRSAARAAAAWCSGGISRLRPLDLGRDVGDRERALQAEARSRASTAPCDRMRGSAAAALGCVGAAAPAGAWGPAVTAASTPSASMRSTSSPQRLVNVTQNVPGIRQPLADPAIRRERGSCASRARIASGTCVSVTAAR